MDIILKEDHLRTIPSKFGYNWLNGFREVDKNVNPHRLNVKLSRAMAAMFDGARKKTNIISKGGHPRTVSANFGKNWFSFLKEVKENVKIPIGSNVKL